MRAMVTGLLEAVRGYLSIFQLIVFLHENHTPIAR